MVSRNLTDGARRAGTRAVSRAAELGQSEISPGHLLWSLLAEESLAFEILERVGIDQELLQSRAISTDAISTAAISTDAVVPAAAGSPIGTADEPAVDDDPTLAALTRDVRSALAGLQESAELSNASSLSSPAENDALQNVWQLAGLFARVRTRHDEIGSEHLLAALCEVPSEVSSLLQEFGISAAALGMTRLRNAPLGEPMDVEFQIDWDRDAPSEQAAAYRVLDAAANRVREGLRVVEDFVRFTLDDAHLSRLLKSARHQLTAVFQFFDSDELIAARDTQADVGTSIRTSGEMSRASLLDVARANLKRVQEAARTLEEFSKIVAPVAPVAPGRFESFESVAASIESAAASIESGAVSTESAAVDAGFNAAGLGVSERFGQLRYSLYTIEKAVLTSVASRSRLDGCGLYLLLTSELCRGDVFAVLEDALRGGVRIVQIREKSMSDRELLAHARRVRELTRERGARLIINDRPDLAVLSDADGVHVGQDELTVYDARRIVGPERLIGVSTHSIEQARQAVLDGANYLGVGPVFRSGTKSFTDDEFVGLDLIRDVAGEISLPWYAIGGISLSNADSVIAAGARRIAVTGAVCSAESARSAASALVRKLRVD